MNQVMDTEPLWFYLFVRRHIKKVDETYSYLQYRNGYLPLRRNRDWHRLLFPYYKLGTWNRWITRSDEFRPCFLETIDELSHFFSMFIESEAVEFTIERDTWWEIYQSLPEQDEPPPDILTHREFVRKYRRSAPDPRKPNMEVINQWLGHNNTTKLNKTEQQ